MKYIQAFFLLFSFPIFTFSQTNIISTNSTAEQVLLGNYDPSIYAPPNPVTDPDSIIKGIHSMISTDTLLRYMEDMATFQTRNTGADTVSNKRGIGAARRWVFREFQSISARTQGRLIPSYLQFDRGICGAGQHRNIFAVLPGLDTSFHDIIILEGHLDSRCEVLCDTACLAEGMEDNASGTALVIELARVMSQYSFNHTIVFMATIGEEQGLFGADAFGDYCLQKGIGIKAVLNNDVIGGIICGQTSSPPSCPGLNHIDSTQVRLFSHGGFNSRNKQLCRFIKLQYQEELQQHVSVPMMLTVMTAEDRTGRGGDHIPFRQKGFAAMRFTSANEHGDASAGPGYTDRQHSIRDILGVDLDTNGTIDSFFVDFNYLARNCAINGTGAVSAALGPITPDFSTSIQPNGSVRVEIIDQTQYPAYRIAIRLISQDWDTVYTMTSLVDTIKIDSSINVKISVASVDANGIESLFTREELFHLTPMEEPVDLKRGLTLFQNKPNPFDEATMISFLAEEKIDFQRAYIRILDQQGNELQLIPTDIRKGVNEVVYTHGYNRTGVLIYQLEVDGQLIESKKMVFAN